jgi:transcriptional regulator with XRE-family HTH domain
MFNIGLKIKELMGQEKIDTPELAKRIGKTKQAVYAMLEKEDINTAVLRDISKVFNVPITFFFGDSSQENIDLLKNEIQSLKDELQRLRELKLPERNDKALDVSMKFFEAAKEMFSFYSQMKGE